MDVQDIDVSI